PPSLLADHVAVGARADVAGRILWLAAHRAGGATGLHERAGALDERGGLRLRDGESCRGGLGRRWRALLFLLLDLLVGNDHDAPAALVVAHADRGDRPCGIHGLDQRAVLNTLALHRTLR